MFVIITASPVIVKRLSRQTIKTEGQPLVLSCQAEGLPLPNITWYINGHVIVHGDGRQFQEQITSNGTFLSSKLSVAKVRYADRGQYSCVFSNYRGSVKSTGNVEVQGMIILVVQ